MSVKQLGRRLLQIVIVLIGISFFTFILTYLAPGDPVRTRYAASGMVPTEKELQEERGLTYLFIAHDLSVVKYISDRVVVMYLGTMVETAETDELYAHPMHPYTQALLSAIPEADPNKAKANQRIPIKGEIPSPINPKNCCRFAERCQHATERCFKEMPQMREIAPGHKVACHLVEDK